MLLKIVRQLNLVGADVVWSEKDVLKHEAYHSSAMISNAIVGLRFA